MSTYSLNTSFLRIAYPLLETCYGFDYSEIRNELSNIHSRHVKMQYADWQKMQSYKEKRTKDSKSDFKFDDINRFPIPTLGEDCKDKEGNIRPDLYGLKSDDMIEIPVPEEAKESFDNIKTLCIERFQDKTDQEIASLVLCFMTAIFYRDINHLTANEGAEDIKYDFFEFTEAEKPDLLKLFITLNEPKHEFNTPIKISLKNNPPTELRNLNGWLLRLLNDHIKEKMGTLTIEQAKEELKLFYSDSMGRKSSNPYLNYIINGTYNFIATLFPSEGDKVTVEQCCFLLDYLKAARFVEEGSTLDKLNTLQSTVRSMLQSKATPVDKHVHNKRKLDAPKDYPHL